MRVLSRKRRGSALILAVAVLTLLAVMGTVYLVTSRLYVQSLNSLTEQDYFDMASEEFLSTIQQRMLNDQWVNDTTTKIPYFQYDPISPGTGTGIGTSVVNRETAWLCRSLLPAQTDDDPATVISNPAHNISVIADRAYNPSTGRNDIDNEALALRLSAIEYFVPAVGPVDRVYLTSTQSPSGTRYRFAARIVDTNRMANLNVSSPTTGANPAGTYVTGVPMASLPIAADAAAIHSSRAGGSSSYAYTYSARTWDAVAMTPEVPSFFATGGSVGARENLYNTLGLTTSSQVDPFTIEDELGLRRYDSTLSTATATRLSGLSPVLAMSTANTQRNPYTVYSFDRSLRSVLTYNPATGDARATYDDPRLDVTTNVTEPYAFTVNANLSIPLKDTTGNILHWQVWPSRNVGGNTSNIVMPVKININNNVPAPYSANVYADADNGPSLVAAIATNLATVMKKLSYGPPPTFTFNEVYTFEEYAAVAANYINTRYTPNDSTVTAYTLPYGPSGIDEYGLLVRGSDRATPASKYAVRDFAGAATNKDLHVGSGTAKEMIIGYAPQPFLNEVAVRVKHDTSVIPATDVIEDFAVEIANPYPVDLDLKAMTGVAGSQGWKLKLFRKSTWALIKEVDLSTVNSGKINAAGASDLGYLVIAQDGTKFQNNPVTPNKVDSAFKIDLTTDDYYVVLTRPMIQRRADQTIAAVPASDVVDVPVDVIEILRTSPLLTNITSTTGEDRTMERFYDSANFFQCDSAVNDVTTGSQTLGYKNSKTGDGGKRGFSLYDRFLADASINSGDPFDNLADFNRCIVRVANHVKRDTTDTFWTLVPADSFAGKIANLTPPSISTAIEWEGKIRFNFLDATANAPAPKLLEYLSSGDRATNERIIANAIRPADKVRIPGRVNVNTASTTVLSALMNEVGIPASISGPFITARTAEHPASIVRNNGDLLNAMKDTSAGVNTLYGRDIHFAHLLNRVTFSSDTFMVYIYGQAIRRNPSAGAFDDAGDWYTAIAAGKLEQKKDRRFVAVLDRSFCNYPVGGSNFVTPARAITLVVSPN